MASQRKNKQIILEKDEYQILSCIKEGIFGDVKKLMSKKQRDKFLKNAKNHINIPITFAPQNSQELIKDLKIGEEIDFVCENELVGSLKLEDKFLNNKKYFDIFRLSTCELGVEEGYCIAGELNLPNNYIKQQKERLAILKSTLSARKVTGIVASLDPLHRAHEKILRWAIDKADLLVIFLIESYHENGLDFELKKKCFEDFTKKYLPLNEVVLIPLPNIKIFNHHLHPLLECALVANFGCTKIVLGQNQSSLNVFFDNNQTKSILDEYQKNNLVIIILPELVYCERCEDSVSVKTCPHGAHHHIRYHTSSIKQLMRMGILPPPILMRLELSSMILSSFFKDRFHKDQYIYDMLFPNSGLLEEKNDNLFYKKLFDLYKLSK